MKRIAVGLLFFAFSATVPLCAQGLVNFANTPSTLVTVQAQQYNGSFSVMSGPPGTFYFELFLGVPSLSTATGIYATNTGVNGLFNGGTVAVPGWAAGTSKQYAIGGWFADMGHDFNPQWLYGSDGFGVIGGSGVAGNGTFPILNLFDGGGNTIQIGFTLRNTDVPEPSTPAILAVGTALILLGRTRRCKKAVLI